MTELQRILIKPGNTGWLLSSLVIGLALVPFAELLPKSRLAVNLGATLITIVAAVAMWRREMWRMPAVSLALIAVPVTWVSFFVHSRWLFVCQCFFASLFFGFAACAVLVLSVRHRFMTLDAVLGAFAAYLLFGLAWAYIYWGIDVASPGSFQWPMHADIGRGHEDSTAVFSELVYYSMVTMSTLGYGDITPVGGFARTLSWMQSVSGQFYVAVVIAWLVSALPRDMELTRRGTKVT